MKSFIYVCIAFASIASLLGCSIQSVQPHVKPDGYGSITTYVMEKSEGGGEEMEYCFHYSKRIWELGSLVQAKSLSLQAASDISHKNLGKLGAAEDVTDITRLSSGEYSTPEQMAGTRFFQCGKTLRLPVENRHLAVSESCFSLLKLPRYVDGQRSRGVSAEQTKVALREANRSLPGGLLTAVVDDVYKSRSVSQLNELYRTMFLSCLVAGGSPLVRWAT